MNASVSDRRWLWWGGLFVVLLVLAAHWQGLYGQFLDWDDGPQITRNPAIRAISLHNLWLMFTQPTAKLYIPLTCVSFAVDYQIWGRDPFGYHFTNLVLHLANTLLVMALVYRVLRRRHNFAAPVAVLTAALFGVHPLRVESVAWATERKDVLFAFFFLSALLAYLVWAGEGKRSAYWACFLLFVASVLSKSTAITFPVLLLMLDAFLFRRRALAEKIPFFVVSLILGAVTFVSAASGKGETIVSPEVIPLWGRMGLIGYCALFYVRKFFWPFHLSAVYPAYDEMGWGLPTAIGWAIVLLLVTAAFVVLRRRMPVLLPSWLWYLITLSPTLGLVPAGIHVVADRFSYLPLLGLALPLELWIGCSRQGAGAGLPRRRTGFCGMHPGLGVGAGGACQPAEPGVEGHRIAVPERARGKSQLFAGSDQPDPVVHPTSTVRQSHRARTARRGDRAQRADWTQEPGVCVEVREPSTGSYCRPATRRRAQCGRRGCLAVAGRMLCGGAGLEECQGRPGGRAAPQRRRQEGDRLAVGHRSGASRPGRGDSLTFQGFSGNSKSICVVRSLLTLTSRARVPSTSCQT